MAVYNCGHCDKWLDNDYFPAEFIKKAQESDEYPLCEDCFADYSEESENEQM
jgi:hypothetical protein|tara:strand:+ start:828 stop:983 length:156 start_codon:yes stop_codon:yes gene_type:complete